MEIVVFGALVATINKLFGAFKSATRRDWNPAVSLLVMLIIGVLVLLLAANSAITEAYAVPGFTEPLGELDLGSIVLFSLLSSSTAGFLYDWRKAVDNSDTASEPSLLSHTPPPNG